MNPLETTDRVQRVNLGKTDIQISPMGVGTWAWGDHVGVWGYGRGEYSDRDLREAFDVALGAGINLFDTAEVYGNGRSEKFLGQFIRETNAASVVVATKFFPYPWRMEKKALLRALTVSLLRLGLPQADLYQIHWPTPLMRIPDLMEMLGEAARRGMVRAVGVSNYSAAQMQLAQESLAKYGITLASNQVEYSLLQRAPEKNGVMAACKEMGVTLIAYSPLAMGVLTGKYTPENPLSGMRGMRYNRQLDELQPLLNEMKAMGEAHEGKTTAQVALNWIICKGGVPIPGAKNARQVLQNAGALGWRLTEAEIERLDDLSSRISN